MTNRIKQSFCSLAATLLMTLLLVPASFAQNSTVRGQVVDELKAVIPGADIVLTSPDGKQRKAKSVVSGEFSIANVPPGIYTLTCAFQGFQTVVMNDLKIPLDKPSLEITMIVGTIDVVTDVSANTVGVSTNPDENMSATVLSEEFIKGLPDNEDDLRDYLNMLAGPTASGGNGNSAEILVDGFSGGRLPPKEAILQIRINQSPYSAEYSNPGFGRIEIITKPGNDRWRGSGGWGYRNSALDARNAFALVKPDQANNRFNFNFGGPIIKKKMSATLFADRNMTDGSNNTYAKTLTGDFFANVPIETISTFVGLRTDYLLNDRNTLNTSYNYRQTDSMNQEFAPRGGGGGGFGGGGFGGGGFGGGGGGFGGGGGGGSTTLNLLPERGSNRNTTGHNLRVSETWIISSKMIHEARFQFSRDNSDQTALFNGLAINVLDAFSGGGSTCCPNSTQTTQFEYQDYLTYTSKGAKHTIKGGVQVEHDSYDDLSGSNFNGTYTFSTLDQYRLALADPTNPLARATQFTINQGDPSLNYGMFTGSWFVGDDWRIQPRLTISFGMRHEFQTHLQDKKNFAPRFGIAWSPFKSGKTTIRGGGGIFFERLRNSSYENSIRYGGGAALQQSFLVRNAIYAPTAAEALVANAAQLTSSTSTTLRPLDPNLVAPYDINASISLEQQLPKGLIGSVTYLYTRGIHQFRTRNINAPIPDPANPGQFIRPMTGAGQIYQYEASALNTSNQLRFNINRRMGRAMMFGGYTLSWIRSNGEGSPADNYNLIPEWGRSNADRRHSVFSGNIFTLPWGMRMGAMINASSGAPFNITTGLDTNNDGQLTERPIGLDGLPIQRNSNLSPSLYGTAQFNRLICPPGKTCTTLADRVNLGTWLQQTYPNGVTAQGPGNFQVSMDISKTFGFGKSNNNNNAQNQGGGGGRGGRGGGGGMRGGGGMMGGPMMMGMGGSEGSRYSLTFQLRVTNVFNRVNFGNYQGTLGSAFFGIPSSASAARQLDMNVRFNF
ncbi:MAG: carboxypeptidase regulatory-like domain-containing protein [Acidobacteria bacterium]|nr:carboxypeptidase regulatory-like domain-containing protein [Acidobacteriota bacterium]